MKSLNIIAYLSTLLLLTACSSDPCEDITCLNGGTCDDGTCQCPSGWTGADCATFDFSFVGAYTSQTLTFSNCNSPTDNGNLPANADDRYCFTNADNNLSCQRLLLQLNADGSAVFTDIRTEVIGGIDFSQPTRIEGSYTTDNEVITFTDQGNTSSLTFQVTDDRSSIAWELPSRSSATGCLLTHLFTK